MPDKKLTDSEIVKALECCGDEEGLNWCVDCPYYDKENDLCKEDLHRDALNLINRLEARNELLAEENEELKIELESHEFYYEQAKAEAYKELLNLLESKLVCKSKITAIGYESAIIDLKNLLKEKVGEDNA